MRVWARELGFSQIGVAGIDLTTAEAGLKAWLDAGFQGSMQYMAAHGLKRARPAELVPGTVSVITARMDYLPRRSGSDDDWVQSEWTRLEDPRQAVVSLYARGRDYHKVLRHRLQRLAQRIAQAVGPFGHRAFTDSAPVLEVELATRSGLGWRGKHTLALDRAAGSMFFLGELFVDLALPPSLPAAAHCGRCTACIDVCPTGAIVGPYRLDARRCISYLTIEHEGPIPLQWRTAIGNRIYGCDDCQLACPWNRYAKRSALPDFDERHGLGRSRLLDLWGWDEPQWRACTEGSAIRRIGWERWRRNLAVALGNALRASGPDPVDRPGSNPGGLQVGDAGGIRQALVQARGGASPLVQEHIDWALAFEAAADPGEDVGPSALIGVRAAG